MKRLLTIVCLAIAAAPVLARVLTGIVSRPPSGGSVGWALSEDFEGTGYENSWTLLGSGGILNPDYATAFGPLTGAHSLHVSEPAFSQRSLYYDYLPAIATGTNRTGVYFTARFLTNDAAGTVFFFLADNVDNETALSLSLQAGGVVRITSGAGTADTTATITLKHTNHFWVDYLSNQYARVMFTNSYAPPASRPETNSANAAQRTTGIGNRSVEKVYLGIRNFSADHDSVVFDHIRVAFTNINSYP